MGKKNSFYATEALRMQVVAQSSKEAVSATLNASLYECYCIIFRDIQMRKNA
jgi:hypothetical protein